MPRYSSDFNHFMLCLADSAVFVRLSGSSNVNIGRKQVHSEQLNLSFCSGCRNSSHQQQCSLGLVSALTNN